MLFLGGFVAALPRANAQETLRMSAALQTALEARQRAFAEPYYNLKLGAVRTRFHGRMGLEFNDNVRLREEGGRPDLIGRPELGVHVLWPMTERNRLSVSLGVGYEKHVRNTEFDNWFLSPGTEIAFDLFVKDVVINVHNRMTLSQETYSEPAVSRTGRYGRFQNTSGVYATWDLNKLLVMLGYDHDIYLATTDQFNYLDRSSEIFSLRVGYVPALLTLVGLEAGGGFADYDRDVLRDSQFYNVGPCLRSRLTQFIEVRLSAGYAAYFLDDPPLTVTNQLAEPDSHSTAWYADLQFRHRLNALMAYSLNCGHRLTLGSIAQSQELTFVSLYWDWRVFRKLRCRIPLFYEHVIEGRYVQYALPIGEENANRYGAGLSLGMPLGEKTAASAQYTFTLKDSDVPGRSYTQNRLVFSVHHQF